MLEHDWLAALLEAHALLARNHTIAYCLCGWNSPADDTGRTTEADAVCLWADYVAAVLRPHVLKRADVEHVRAAINEYGADAVERGGVMGNSKAAAHQADLNLLDEVLDGETTCA